jgi:hypothetical protein
MTLLAISSGECVDLAAARLEALRLARTIVEEEARLGRRISDYRFVNIRDETGAILLRVPFTDALDG